MRGTLAGALHEHHVLHFLAVGRALDRAAIGFQRQLFQTGLVDHVRGLAVAEFRQLAGVVVACTRGHDDGAEVFGGGGTGLGGNVRRETPRCTAGLGERRVEVHGDFAVGLDLRDHFGHAGVFRVGIRHAFRDALVFKRCTAAELAALFDQGDRVAGRCGFNRRGHADHAAADHQQVVVAGRFLVDIRQRHVLDFGAAHAHVVGGHLLRQLA